MASDLDGEIESLQARGKKSRRIFKKRAPLTSPVASLRHDLKIQTSTLLSASPTRDFLAAQPLLQQRSVAQAAHNQQSLYRACAGVTAFAARDPDPCAVGDGSILGLRFEVASRARFLRPYYVLLNRPYGDRARNHLRVHRHTIPPCVPLAALAARHLPPPPKEDVEDDIGAEGDSREGDVEMSRRSGGRGQDLATFVHALRREIVRYHNRIAGVADLRKAVGLHARAKKRGSRAKGKGDGDGSERHSIVDVSPADASAKQLKIEWADGRTGRLVVGDDGQVTKLVIFGENGRERRGSRLLLRKNLRLEDLAAELGNV